MGSIGTSLSVALIGLVMAGLTILAFRDPATYRKLFPFLVGAVGVIYLVCFVWNCALLRGENAVISAVGGMKGEQWKLDAMQAASKALQATQFPIVWLGGILVCTCAYLCLLRMVPIIRDAASPPTAT
jgi:hypothetical protein